MWFETHRQDLFVLNVPSDQEEVVLRYNISTFSTSDSELIGEITHETPVSTNHSSVTEKPMSIKKSLSVLVGSELHYLAH